MKSSNEIRVKANSSTQSSASDSTKTVILLFMVFLTIFNPILFIAPTVLCGYCVRKGGLL